MKTIIIILVLYLLLRISSKYLLPYLLKRYIGNVKKKFEAQQGATSTTQNGSKINIKYPSRNKFHQNDAVEYTDFEEIHTDQKQ